MSALKGRRRRPTTASGTAAVSLQARVSPEAKSIADRAAAALGVSLASYLDELLRRTERETPDGMPAWVVERIRTEQLEASQLELAESA